MLNHGRDVHGGFRPLGADRHIAVAGEDREGWALPANAMEVVNSGAVLSDGLALPRDWMGMLNRGLMLTPVGSSDSHDVARYIVGQGRTYVRCDDRRPGAIDLARAMESVRRGQVMVSYGLLTEIDVAGQGPGELVRPRGELAVRIRVQGPGWTRAEHVALYVNGTPRPRGRDPRRNGRRPQVGGDVAAGRAGARRARRRGGDRPRRDRPVLADRQALSTDVDDTSRRTSSAMSGAVFVDGDGSGTFDSALAYARRELAGDDRSATALAARLARYDAAVATQAASLLRARDPAGFEATVDAVLEHAPAHVANGLRAYLDAWRAGR